MDTTMVPTSTPRGVEVRGGGGPKAVVQGDPPIADPPHAPPWAVVQVPITQLHEADSPRLNGLDLAHAQLLAEASDLPPILVARASMRVIDGMHRLRAAQLNGLREIPVQFFDGTEQEAFLLAVRLNVAHGMPLTMADRRTAAERIVRSHPAMSDRAIAVIAGVAAKTVASLRGRLALDEACGGTRLGRDGKVRPLNNAEGRRLASKVIAARPDASLRVIAREAGISVGTARNVRQRVQAGEDPVPPRQRAKGRLAPDTPAGRGATVGETDPLALLERLRRDPSLRYTESGRFLLRRLGSGAMVVTGFTAMIDAIPAHCTSTVGTLARAYAAAWTELAVRLERGGND